MSLDVGTLARLAVLLAAPDTPELIGRGHHLTQPGAADRRQRYRAMLVRWAQWRFLEADGAAGEWWGPGRHASAQPARVEHKALRFVKR